MAHIELSKNKKPWPLLDLPKFKGEITIAEVLLTEPGLARDLKIKDWCKSVWAAYSDWQNLIAEIVNPLLSERKK
jgi:hypothetical protein